MSDFTIQAEPREVTGKNVKHLRIAGQIPAVIYGPKVESVVVSLDERELSGLLAEAGGTSVVNVNVGGDTHQVLVRDVQRDILRGDLLHVDLYAVDMTRVTRVEVPVVQVGQSPIVASRAGILIQGVSSVEVEGLPTDLVSELTVDLDDLTEIGMSVIVEDLYVPEGLTVITDPSELVVKVDYMVIEEEEEEEEEELLIEESVEPELVGRGDDEEEIPDDEE